MMRRMRIIMMRIKMMRSKMIRIMIRIRIKDMI